MALKKFYKGFSTRNYENVGGGFEIYDVKCVEEDLLNEIFTIKGERLYMPTYGTRIPTLTFEPNDTETMDVIREDLTNVFNNDPRVSLNSLAINQVQDRYAIIAVASVNYLEFGVTNDLFIEINSR